MIFLLLLMLRNRKFLSTLLLALIMAPALQAAQWIPLGPDGGDVRTLAYDPHNPDRIMIGTSAGQLYLSTNGGGSWTRFAHLGRGDDYVLDNIIFDPVDPQTIYVAAWSVEKQTSGGDLFRTRDGGRSWDALEAMRGKNIRALAQSDSDPKILVVGALDGVFRSRDGGDTWQRISPENHAEIKTIESVAIDPKDPNIIYAGTWHLAWKTDDGGQNWHSIKKGVIDDSDVFSIIVDHSNPRNVYLSACSGIYKSETAAELFHKIQGIPFSARRTRILQQDPVNAAIVYAGTTEGLWKTVDAGKSWSRTTPPNLIINDVLVDPRRPSRVLLATDRSGVLASDNGGMSFVASNRGFSHRQVASVVVDRASSRTLYAGLVNDKEFGGVYVSRNDGASWEQMNAGLDGRDVFTLRQAENGTLLAGTNRGIFELTSESRLWRPINVVLKEKAAPKPATTKIVKGKKVAAKTAPAKPVYEKSELTSRVWQLEIAPRKWFAATGSGLYTSADNGKAWMGGPVLGYRDFIGVDVAGENVIAITSNAAVVSLDGGATWSQASLPRFITTIHSAAVGPNSHLWVAGREGAFRSVDAGKTWDHVLSGLPARYLGSIVYDAQGRRMLATAISSGEVFESTDGGNQWRRAADSGFTLRGLTISPRGRLLAVTSYDGVVAQPEQLAGAQTASINSPGTK